MIRTSGFLENEDVGRHRAKADLFVLVRATFASQIPTDPNVSLLPDL
jgi:hypothetical protein